MIWRRRGLVRTFVGAGVWCAILTIGASRVTGQTQERLPGEIIQYTGDKEPSNPDLRVFFATTKLAFLGTIDRIAPVVLAAPDGQETLFTRMTFKPTEFIKGLPPATFAGTFDVWRWGGSYVETPNGLRPVRPVAVAERLQRDAVYFVAVTTINGYPSLDGRYVLCGDDTLVRVDGEQASALGLEKAWVTAVVAHGRTSMPAPGVLPDDATAFLTAIRRAAAASK